jgi:hypothetical protein
MGANMGSGVMRNPAMIKEDETVIRRFSGDALVRVQIDGPGYVCVVTDDEHNWKGKINPPATAAVGKMDTAMAYDRVARAALAFAIADFEKEGASAFQGIAWSEDQIYVGRTEEKAWG